MNKIKSQTIKKIKKAKIKKDKKIAGNNTVTPFFSVSKTLLSKTKHQKVYDRYSELVEKKYLSPLSKEEETELSVINATLDKLETPVYDAIYSSLKQVLKSKNKQKK